MDMVLRRRVPVGPSARRTPGFTLVEVLIAILLMAVALLAIAPLFTTSLRSNAVGWDYTELNALAKQQLEQVLQYPWKDPRVAVPAGSTFQVVDGSGATVTLTGQLYRNELSLGQTVDGVTQTYPYQMVYAVQDFPLSAIPPPGSTPPNSAAVDDTNSTIANGQGFKLITVAVASSRSGLQGSPYSAADLFAANFTGKQVRMSAFKSP